MCLSLVKKTLSFSIIRPECWHRTSDSSRQKIELYPMKTASQRTHGCPAWSLKKIIRYQRLKTQKHSVRIGLSCFGCSCYEHFNRQLLLMQFFYVQNRNMYSSKKILYQYFVDFFLKTFYISLHNTKNLRK